MSKGYTLLELMVVMTIFVLLFGSILGVLSSSDRSWQTAKNKLIEEQQARRALDPMLKLLRQADPVWVLNNTTYGVTISENNSRIDFYQPVFNASGNITSLKKVTFKLDPTNTTQLLEKQGTEPSSVIATAIQSLRINCGCAGCTAIDQNCSVAKIDVVTTKNVNYNLSTLVTLRNTNQSLSADVDVEQPAQGEF